MEYGQSSPVREYRTQIGVINVGPSTVEAVGFSTELGPRTGAPLVSRILPCRVVYIDPLCVGHGVLSGHHILAPHGYTFWRSSSRFLQEHRPPKHHSPDERRPSCPGSGSTRRRRGINTSPAGSSRLSRTMSWGLARTTPSSGRSFAQPTLLSIPHSVSGCRAKPRAV